MGHVPRRRRLRRRVRVLAAAGAGLVKDMLPDDDLASANAASTTVTQGLRIASPLAGAALYARFGGGAVAVLDSATFLAAIAALLSVHVPETSVAVEHDVPVRAQMLAGSRPLAPHARPVPDRGIGRGGHARARLLRVAHVRGDSCPPPSSRHFSAC